MARFARVIRGGGLNRLRLLFLAAVAAAAGLYLVFEDWFDWVTPVHWLRGLLLGALGIAAVAGLLGHWPRVIPGPVTAGERRKSRWSPVSRFAHAVWLLALVGAVATTAVWIVAPPRRPLALWLYSRARVTAQAPDDAPHLTDLPRGAFPADLGPAVDHILARCEREGAADWAEPNGERREWIRQTVLGHAHVLRALSEPQARPPVYVRTPPWKLPRWLVEEVEVTVTRAALRQLNVRQVRVAAAPSDDARGWPLAARLLSTSGRPVECVDPLPRSDGPLVIRRLFAGRQSPAGGIRFLMQVDGPSPAGGSVAVRLVGGGVVGKAAVPQPVPKDAGTHRIVRGTIPAPPGGPRPDLGRGARLTDLSGSVSTPVRTEELRAPTLRILGAKERAVWAAALQLVHKDTDGLCTGLRAELNALNLPLPRVDPLPAASGPHCVLLTRPPPAPGVIVATTEQAALRAAAQLGRNPGATTGAPIARVVRQDMGPPTALSWQGLPLPPGWPGEGGPLRAVPGADRATANRLRAALDLGKEPLWQDAIGNPLILTGRASAARFVALDLRPVEQGLLHSAAGPNYDPAQFAALVRTLAWACQYVTDPDEMAADLAPDDPARATPFPAPVLTEYDLQQGLRENLVRGDVLALLLLAVYLGVLAWRIRQAHRVV